MILNQLELAMKDKKRNCSKHGYVLFKYKQNKKGSWYVCHECLKMQWRKASAKRRTSIEVKKYHNNYNTKYTKIRKSLSVYLVMILLAADIKPE